MALRHNQRVTADIVPMEETDEDEPDSTIQPLMMLKRNLISDFGRPSVLEPPVPSEHMPVYLRIRPFSKDETERNEDQGCYIVESDKTVVTHPPKDSHFFKNMTRGLCKSTTKYTFSQIFNENTSQKDFFNSTMLNYVKDFIDGQNCLVFSYGVTSSGKTYTIQGNPKDAGILPRALDVLFNSIHGKQWNGMDLKPQMFTEVVRLSPEQEQHEKRMKEATLKLSLDDDMDVMSLLGDDASDISSATNSTACSEGSNMSSLAGKEFMDCSQQLFLDLEQRVREEGKVSVDEQGQVKFSVWVSFAEIYNEQIYDLLVPIAKKKNARRPCLKLSEDKHGSPYIKDLKYIHVGSADEAYKLLTIGQRNLQKACTKMNQNSSRSHCIFNIKILRVIDKDNPHVARVSMLTLCDLAGSERYSKTQNTGDRLKEAGNINTSLLTLGRCIETLRYNQAHKDQQRIIPFRESKLTRLFQNNFSGRGKAAMIVNVNQLSTMFDETMHVFKFSAIASKVEVQQKPVFIKPKMPIAAAPSLIPRTSISWATPARNHGLKQHEAENVPLPDDSDLEEEEEEEKTYTQENIDELLEIIEQLQGDLQSEVHTRWKLEKQIRTEVCAEMMRQFSQIEEEHSERIRQREVRAEELNEKRIQIILNAERSRRQALEATNDGEEEWVSSVYLHQERLKNEQKDSTIRELRQEIERLTSQSVGAVTEGSEKPKGLELDTQLKEQLAKIEEERQAAESLRRQLQEYTDHITKLEQKLAQATSAKASMSELEEKLAEYEATIKALQCEMAQKAVKDAGSGDDHLMDNLTHQLQQARDKVKEQEDEMVELNDMLREAGETFTLKEAEIERLKQLTAQYEQQLEDQREAIKVLERAASDGKTAMELADQSLSKREECVSTLQAEIRGLEGMNYGDIVPETPSKSSNHTPISSVGLSKQLQKFRESISSIDFSYTKDGRAAVSSSCRPSSVSHVRGQRLDSSGVVADCESEDFSDSEVFKDQTVPPSDKFNIVSTQTKVNQVKPSAYFPVCLNIENIVSDCASDLKDNVHHETKGFNFKEAVENKKNANYCHFYKPLNDSRVLQVVLTPINNKHIIKQTKSSMLRLKNSPVKDPTRGRECLKNSPLVRRATLDKENKAACKRKCDTSPEQLVEDLNTSKRRKVVPSKNKGESKTKPITTNKSGQKYNLRTRR